MLILKQVTIFINYHISFFEHFHWETIRISIIKYDTFYSAINNHFCTNITRLMSTIQGCILNGNANLSSLNNCILFCMNCITNFMASTWRDILFNTQALPPSLQLVMPLGAPLYPVVKIRLFLTITAPTCLSSL